jgi:hypothetical protein
LAAVLALLSVVLLARDRQVLLTWVRDPLPFMAEYIEWNCRKQCDRGLGGE